MKPTVRRAFGTLTTLAVTALFTMAAPFAASASPVESAAAALQQRVDSILAEYPGGVQTGANVVSWDNGDIVLTLDTAINGIVLLAVGSCETGKYCAYSGIGLTGSKITFTTCDITHSTSPIGTVRSIANARSSGRIEGKSSSGVVLASVGSDASIASTPIGITQVTCVS